jgi:outer membrane receptor protein involved in Fe transport
MGFILLIIWNVPNILLWEITMKLPYKKCTLALAVSMLSSFSSISAVAAEESAEPERIIVTGSRIPRENLVKAGAVTVISRADVEASGFTNFGDMLQSLTVAGGGVGSRDPGNAKGVTTFDLRGLGSNRTLILLNSRRLPNGGTGADISPDISAIPTAIIERVEILLDGASAVYGSDAVGGVVNIITRHTEDIFEVTANYGESSRGDAESLSLELVAGIVGDKGRFMVSASYDEKKAVWGQDRDFSLQALNLNADGSKTPGGSSAVPWSHVVVKDAEGNDIHMTRGPEFGEWREINLDSSDPNNDRYNYMELSYLQTPFEKYSFSSFGEYEFGDLSFSNNVTFNMEALYSHRKSTTVGAPQPLVPVWGGYLDFTYSPDNYYNKMYGPKDANGNPYAFNDWYRRMIETNGRANNIENSQYRIVMALSGEFNDDWNWDLAFNYGRNDNKRLKTGIFNWPAAKAAVGPTHFDGDNVLRCGASAETIIDGCVPLNIFGQPGVTGDYLSNSEITPDMLGWLSGDWPQLQHGFNQTKIISANVAGIVTELPAGPLGVSFGVERQEIDARMQTDAVAINILVTDGLGRPTGGGYNVDEAYVEFAIPLLTDVAFAQTLELNVASRFSDYDTFGSTTNSKVGLFWALNDELSFRGTWSEAFRAPNIVELFEGQLPAFETGTDPCANTNNPNANCISTGVPQAGYNTTLNLVRTNTGGNPKVEPETAIIKTLGIIYQPSWLTDASITFDFYDIALENAISKISAMTKLQECMDNGAYCESIHRVTSGEFSGVLQGVDTFTENLNTLDRSGFDAEYSQKLAETSFGDFNLTVNWSHVTSHKSTEPAATTYEDAGVRHNGSFAIPKDKVNASLRWNYEDISATWNVYYISSMDEKSTEDGGIINGFSHTLDSSLMHNAQFSYALDDYNTQLSFGISNIFDEEPPFAFGGGNNSDSIHSSYMMGREFYGRVKLSF